MTQATADMAPGKTAEATELTHLDPDRLPRILALSMRLRNFVDLVGRFGSWFALPLILITAFDLGIRKTGWMQVWFVENISPYFGSTLLQELEWHAHTVLFCLVLGFGYIWNTHVRVDLVRETLNFRKKAWIEFLGLNLFLIPFTLVVTYFAFVYAYDSWSINREPTCAWYECGEVSASLVGLSHRWVIKLILAFGLVVVLLAGIAVWIEVAVALFGPRHWRYHLSTLEWPEAAGSTIEGKERLDLDAAPDELERRARSSETAAAPRDGGGLP